MNMFGRKIPKEKVLLYHDAGYVEASTLMCSATVCIANTQPAFDRSLKQQGHVTT